MKLCLQLTVMSIYHVTVVDTSVRSLLSRLCLVSWSDTYLDAPLSRESALHPRS